MASFHHPLPSSLWGNAGAQCNKPSKVRRMKKTGESRCCKATETPVSITAPAVGLELRGCGVYCFSVNRRPSADRGRSLKSCGIQQCSVKMRQVWVGPFYNRFIYTGKHRTETTAKIKSWHPPIPLIITSLTLTSKFTTVVSSVTPVSQKIWKWSLHGISSTRGVRILPAAAMLLGVGSILPQISHDRNPIRVESLCNYVIKMYWFKPEVGTRWTCAPGEGTALCCMEKNQNRGGGLFVEYILIQHLCDVKHIRDLSKRAPR